MDTWGTSSFFCPYHIGAIFGRVPKKPRSPASLSLDWLLVPTRLSQPSAKFSSVRSWWATSPLIAFISGHIYCSVSSTRLCVSLLLSVSLFAPSMVMTRATGSSQVFERAGISGRWIPETQCGSSTSCFWASVARVCRWSGRDLISGWVQDPKVLPCTKKVPYHFLIVGIN